jgi:hypothetical protein
MIVLLMELYEPLFYVCGTTVATYLFYLIDRALLLTRFQKPYYAVHVLHNIGIVALTAGDLVRVFSQFYEIPYLPFNWPAVCLCYALHFYHCIVYWRSFHLDDWLHHILMIGVAMPLGSTVSAGPLMGFSLFFTTGLPGAISYTMLFAEKNGWITRTTSKRWNAAANVWIRAPGCSAQAALTLASLLSNRTTTTWEFTVGLCTATLNYWNGQYFMQQVVASNTKEVEQANANNRVQKADE